MEHWLHWCDHRRMRMEPAWSAEAKWSSRHAECERHAPGSIDRARSALWEVGYLEGRDYLINLSQGSGNCLAITGSRCGYSAWG